MWVIVDDKWKFDKGEFSGLLYRSDCGLFWMTQWRYRREFGGGSKYSGLSVAKEAIERICEHRANREKQRLQVLGVLQDSHGFE